MATFEYEKFYRAVFDLVKTSDLNIGAVYFILKTVLHEVENYYYAQVNKEKLVALAESPIEGEKNGDNS